MSIVICHTEGCGNEGVPIELATTWTDEEGGVHDVGAVICGACGQPITDITNPENTDPENTE